MSWEISKATNFCWNFDFVLSNIIEQEVAHKIFQKFLNLKILPKFQFYNGKI